MHERGSLTHVQVGVLGRGLTQRRSPGDGPAAQAGAMEILKARAMADPNATARGALRLVKDMVWMALTVYAIGWLVGWV